MSARLALTILTERFAVCRLDTDAALPPWAEVGRFLTITRTPKELSIVAEEWLVPLDVRAERGWRCAEVAGPIPFEVTGVAAGLASPLAAAGISLFIISTYDTDYVLVKDDILYRAVDVWRGAGIDVTEMPAATS